MQYNMADLEYRYIVYCNILLYIARGVARPGPTRACALPSTLQALPSAIIS